MLMQTGSATQTAKLLSTSQATISRDLAEFERSLGFKLFDRSHGKLVPTRKSAMIFSEVQKSYRGLERVHEMVNRFKQSPDGFLAIAADQSVAESILPLAYQRFRQRHELTSISVDDPSIDEISNGDSANAADLVLVVDIKPPMRSRFEQLIRSEAVCVAPAGHPLLSAEKVSLAELTRWPLIQHEGQLQTAAMLRSSFIGMNLAWKPVVEAMSTSAVLSFVRSGVGVAVVDPLSAAATAPGLSFRPLESTIPFELSLMRSAKRFGSPVVDDFVGFVHEAVEALSLKLEAQGVGVFVFDDCC